MARTFIDEVEESTRQLVLMPERGLIRRMMMDHDVSPERRVDALGHQARLAKRGGYSHWLRTVARDADDLQVTSRDWIRENIFDFGWRKQHSSASSSLTASHDIRLQTDPTLGRRFENAATGEVLDQGDMDESDMSLDLTVVPQQGATARIEALFALSTSSCVNAQRVESSAPVTSTTSRGVNAPTSNPTTSTTSRGVNAPTSKPTTSRGANAPVGTPTATATGPNAREDPMISLCVEDDEFAAGTSTYQSSRVARQPDLRSTLSERASRFTQRQPRRWHRPSEPRGRGMIVVLDDQPRPSLKRRARSPDQSSDITWQPVVTSSPKPKSRRHALSTSQGDVIIQAEVSHVVGGTIHMGICPIGACAKNVVDLRQHAFDVHLPTTFDETLSPKDEAPLRAWALRMATRWMLGSRASLEDLVAKVEGLGLLQGIGGLEVNPAQSAAMDSICEALSLPLPGTITGYSCRPLNSPACLFHWRVMLEILADLTGINRTRFRDNFNSPAAPRTVPEPQFVVTLKGAPARTPSLEAAVNRAESTHTSSLDATVNRAEITADSEQPTACRLAVTDSRVPEAFDSHFHLDRTRGVLRLPATASLDTVLRHISPPKKRAVTLVGSVAVFCDPISYPTPDDVRNLRAQGMTVAVGLHPKNAKGTSSKDIQALRRLVKMPEVVGFGEIGLDQTTPAPEWDDQIDVLCEIGRYIEKRHVVILHCRSNNQDPDFSIYRIMRHHLRQCSVPRHQKIHLHCFSGDKQAVKDWLEEYPNTYFGFTRLVDTFSSEQKEAVNCVNDTRLLLETDAPYFQFRRYRPQCGSNSTPALIGLTAVEVAQVRQTTWRQILKLTTANAQRLYCNQ